MNQNKAVDNQNFSQETKKEMTNALVGLGIGLTIAIIFTLPFVLILIKHGDLNSNDVLPMYVNSFIKLLKTTWIGGLLVVVGGSQVMFGSRKPVAYASIALGLSFLVMGLMLDSLGL